MKLIQRGGSRISFKAFVGVFLFVIVPFFQDIAFAQNYVVCDCLATVQTYAACTPKCSEPPPTSTKVIFPREPHNPGPGTPQPGPRPGPPPPLKEGEKYLLFQAEQEREGLETFRQDFERALQNNELSRSKYLEELRAYKFGIQGYKEFQKDFRSGAVK